MNHILNRLLPFLMKTPIFLSIVDTFWAIHGAFFYSTSVNDPLTIELNYPLNWISTIFFELNNILNWILGKAILNRLLNESLFGKIQKLNWIRLGYRPPLTCRPPVNMNFKIIIDKNNKASIPRSGMLMVHMLTCT